MDPLGEEAFSDLLKSKRWSIANELMKRRDSPDCHEHFVYPARIKGGDDGAPLLWSDRDLRTLFPNLRLPQRRRVQERYSICLAILVWMKWPLQVGPTLFQARFRDHFYGSDNPIDDESLPLQDDDNRIISALEREAAKSFLNDQYTFCPYIISGRSEGDPPNAYRRPMPFTEEPLLIGRGMSGDVRAVKIASGCFEDEDGRSSGPKLVAYKHFVAKANSAAESDFAREIAILQELKRTPLKHDHIIRHLADVVRPDQYFIFFRHTHLGDLETLFGAGFDLSLPTVKYNDRVKPLYSFDGVFMSPPRHLFVEQLMQLASALSFLHNRSGSNHNGRVYAHFDLRPSNILIYPCVSKDRPRPNIGTWKLADFGIAYSSRLDSTGASPDPSFTSPWAAKTQTTLNGPHRAPELQMDGAWATYIHCDEWAFGCITNEVFVFILKSLGPDAGDAVRRLQRFREDKKNANKWSGAWFNADEAASGIQDTSLVFNAFVDGWLNERESEGTAWEQDMCALIRRALCLADSCRMSTEEMFGDLCNIYKLVGALEETSADRRELHPSTSTMASSRTGSLYSGRLLIGSDGIDGADGPARILQHPVQKVGRVNLSKNRVIDLAIAPDCSLVAYLYRRDPSFSISIFAPDLSTRRGLPDMLFRSEWPLSDNDFCWKKVDLGSGLLIVSGQNIRKSIDARMILDLEDPYKPRVFSVDGALNTCGQLTGSCKAIIWEVQEDLQTLRIWTKYFNTVTRKAFKGRIAEVKLNASSTMLYVWETQTSDNHLHILDLTLPDIPSSSVNWPRRELLAPKIWPAPTERLCVVQDAGLRQRRVIHFDAHVIHRTIVESELRKGSASAMSDSSLITVRHDKFPRPGWLSFSQDGIRITRHEFDLDQPESLGQEEEAVIGTALLDDLDIKMACHLGPHVERIVVCGISGNYCIHDNPVIR